MLDKLVAKCATDRDPFYQEGWNECREAFSQALARRDGGEGEKPFMYAYECVDDGRWQAYRQQLKRADGSICPGVALYRHPADPRPDPRDEALREAREAMREAASTAYTARMGVQSRPIREPGMEAILTQIYDAADQALAKINAVMGEPG